MPTNITRHITPLRILFATAAILVAVAGWIYISSYLAKPKITTDYAQKLTDLARQHQPGSDTQPNRRDEFLALISKVEQLQADVGQGESPEVRLLIEPPEPRTESQIRSDEFKNRPSPEERVAIAERYMDALVDQGLLEQAGEMTSIRHSVVDVPPVKTLSAFSLEYFGPIGQTRSVVRALTTRARLLAPEGDAEGALDMIERALAVTRLTSYEPFMISKLVANACEVITLETTRDLTAHHTFNRAQLDRLERIIDEQQTVSIEYHIRTERAIIDDAIQHIYSDDGSGDGILLPGEVARYAIKTSGSTPPAVPGHMNFMGLFAPSRAEVTDALDEIFGAAIDVARDPAIPASHAEQAFDQHEPVIDDNTIFSMLMPAIDRSVAHTASITAHRAGTTTTLALEHHYIDRGAYPATLDALVPEYIDQLPDDPNAPDGRLIYIPNDNATAYTLYSVGQNRVDDNASEDDDIILVTQ